MSSPLFISAVRLRNFKSIARCSVSLKPLTILIGPNGSAKSNLLDALRFLKDALDTNLSHALEKRGGLDNGRSRWAGTGDTVELAVCIAPPAALTPPRGKAPLPAADSMTELRCSIELAGAPDGTGYRVKSETGELRSSPPAAAPHPQTAGGPRQQQEPASFERHYVSADVRYPGGSKLVAEGFSVSPTEAFLPWVGGRIWGELRRHLARMEFYSADTVSIRVPQDPDPGVRLHPDSDNLVSVLQRLKRDEPERLRRIEQFLSAILPGPVAIYGRDVSPYKVLEVDQVVAGRTYRFGASDLSEGTLAALGVLTALFQPVSEQSGAREATLVGFEEPEYGLHPAAAEVLHDALREASAVRQVVVTTHSADMLDSTIGESEALLAVDLRDADTVLGPIDRASRNAVKQGLYTADELMRKGQVEPQSASRKWTGRREGTTALSARLLKAVVTLMPFRSWCDGLRRACRSSRRS